MTVHRAAREDHSWDRQNTSVSHQRRALRGLQREMCNTRLAIDGVYYTTAVVLEDGGPHDEQAIMHVFLALTNASQTFNRAINYQYCHSAL